MAPSCGKPPRAWRIVLVLVLLYCDVSRGLLTGFGQDSQIACSLLFDSSSAYAEEIILPDPHTRGHGTRAKLVGGLSLQDDDDLVPLGSATDTAIPANPVGLQSLALAPSDWVGRGRSADAGRWHAFCHVALPARARGEGRRGRRPACSRPSAAYPPVVRLPIPFLPPLPVSQPACKNA